MARIVEKINEQWEFEKQGKITSISIPHTWNAEDGQTGPDMYFRGVCIYRRHLKKPELAGGQQVYLEFRGVNSSAVVRVNGKELGRHDGGYAAFRVNVTDVLEEENMLEVVVDNAPNTSVYPQRADFTFYGGIYRDVYMIIADASHFDLDDYGGNGFRITPGINGENAVVSFETYSVGTAEKIIVSVAGVGETELALETVGGKTIGKGSIALQNVHKWDGVEDPYLYEAAAVLYCGGEAVDTVTDRFGCREFRFDAEEGFFLNGRRYPLHGVSRHQDRLGVGNALTQDMHEEDMELILDMGANSIRLAHYQHDQYFYDLCDEKGIVVWAEIPYITVHMESGRENTIRQMKELITQNYNHPSICFWGISNEILIGGISDQLVENHKELNALCKELDDTRLTTIAHVSMTPINGPMHGITDVESYNNYFGWYGGKMEDNGPWLDNFHQIHPEICLGVSEYGCEGIITYHGPNPACKDYSEEYQALYHEHLAKVFDERPWIWSTHVWNMFDFGCAARDEGGVAGRNNKGLITIDRKTKKDSYFVYQAYWSKKPMLHLAGKRYAQRAGETTQIRVYSNQPSVALYLNGELAEEKSADKVFVFQVSLKDGFNIVTAVSGDLKDSMTLEKVEKEPSIYVLPEVNERAEGVANWFKLAGDLDLKAPMEFPEGKYNIHNTMEELAQCPEALKVMTDAVKIAMNMKIEPGAGMWDMMKSMTPEKMVGMAGGMAPEGFLESINAKLILIDKK